MKKMKKVISMLLAILMITSVFAMYGVTAFATTSGMCGENAYWNYDASTKTVTVSGTGTVQYPYPWQNFDYENFIVEEGITNLPGCNKETVKYIKLPGTIKCISDYNLAYCPNLKEIELGYGIEALEIGALAQNPSLETVNIPGSVNYMLDLIFHGCTSLKNVTLGEGIEYLAGSMFWDCVSLETITLPNTLKYISVGAFEGCISLKNIAIPDSVKTINNYAFSGCKSLTNVVIPDSVEEIGEGAFYGCESFTSISVPETITMIPSKTFDNCTSLEKIYIYNEHCLIESEDSIYEKTVIYGYTGSSAEEYAEKYDREFVAIDDDLISILTRFFRSCIDFVKSMIAYIVNMFR